VPDHEFGFELRVCAWAESEWTPRRPDSEILVARQLGAYGRRWDTVLVECDPDALRERAAFGERELDSDLLGVVRGAPAEWAWYRDALPEPAYPWRYVREAVHRAAGRDLVETRRDGNRIEIRRKQPYAEWVRRVVAIENKPDLSASAADALADQIERDVALSLADEVWVATEATDERVEPVLLERLPVEAGVLAFSGPDSAAVAWHPATLEPESAGTGIEERGAEECAFGVVPAAEKRAKRRLIAERAYGRGWRSYHETMRPDCAAFTLRRAGEGYVPYCTAKGCEQSAAACSGGCEDFSPEPPPWRTKGWPIAGGPGKRVRELLAARRRRERPGL
jgi:hypothetical protein